MGHHAAAHLQLEQFFSPQALSILNREMRKLLDGVPPLLLHDARQAVHEGVILGSNLTLSIFLHLVVAGVAAVSEEEQIQAELFRFREAAT